MVLWLNVFDKEHLALRDNFAITKKFLITKFDCITQLSVFDHDNIISNVRTNGKLKDFVTHPNNHNVS